MLGSIAGKDIVLARREKKAIKRKQSKKAYEDSSKARQHLELSIVPPEKGKACDDN